MNLQTLQSYSKVVITVYRGSRQKEPGVYIVGEDLPAHVAVALLNDKKAKLTIAEKENENLRNREPVTEESVSISDDQPSDAPSRPKTRTKRRGGRKKSKTVKTKRETIPENNGSETSLSDDFWLLEDEEHGLDINNDE